LHFTCGFNELNGAFKSSWEVPTLEFGNHNYSVMMFVQRISQKIKMDRLEVFYIGHILVLIQLNKGHTQLGV